MTQRFVYKVEEYNRHIPLLFSKYKEGHIHSKFNNGFNIKMGDSLVFIGGKQSGRLPFSFILPIPDVHDLLTKISNNDPVIWHNDTEILSINESCDIVYLEGKPYENKLELIPGSVHSLSRHLETLLLALAGNDEPTGLGLDINEFMEHYVEHESGSGSSFDVYYDLMAILYSEDEQEVERVLRYFLGRGKGGTPTGDDHIIGLMAIYAVSKEWSPLFTETLSRIISSEKITTDVSMEYLKYALNNQFGSPVIELIHAMTEESKAEVQVKINNLLSMGHSSGLDTTFGIILGLLAMRRKSNG